MSTPTTHTPGPWGLQTLTTDNEGYADWPVFCIRSGGSDKGGYCLATIGDVDRATAPRNAANAALIAAAPELLEALQSLENDDNSIPSHAWERVQAAIAKATTLPTV